MSQKTRGPNSPYRRDGAPPGPPPQAKLMYLIGLNNETTEDYLDERRNGGPEDFQLIQLMGPGGQVGTRYIRGKTIWDSFAETALQAIVAATTKTIAENTLSAGDPKQVATMAAAFADAMLEEKKKRDPQRMLIEGGSRLITP